MTLMPVSAGAAPLSASVTTDSLQLIMGSKARLKINVVKPAGYGLLAGEPKVGSEFGGLDILDAAIDSTQMADGRTSVNYTYTYQAFNPGPQTIPPLTYFAIVDGEIDSVKTDPLIIKVMAVDVDSLATIHFDTPVMTTERHWVDYIPDVVADYWWVWLIVVLVVAAALIVWWLIVKKGRLNRVARIFRKPVEPPYDMAIRRLDEIRGQRLALSGNDKHYFTELTDVLRTYLNGRFGIYAMEMTTKQILAAMAANPETAPFCESIAPVLALADSVKFAKLSTTPDENTAAYRDVRTMVEQTKPVETPDPKAQSKSKRAAKGKAKAEGEAKSNPNPNSKN